ncbi:class I SAM-dependent methyltransferase [Micromonospora arborensis]|uniref:class I SAM-dependent methyltransferase n=1 Tax=Micromonospora arborensis TaxID=2116518 RepID=UPI0033FF02E4
MEAGGVIVNERQAQAWNGYEGQHWAEHPDRYDAVNRGFNPLLVAAIQPGDRVLDIGCGNGQLTRLAAAAGGQHGEATGVDLSVPMLRRAEASARAQGVSNVRFIRADAQVHPFPAGSFDVALSRFGVMFFSDPVAAFGNIGRALRPGGRLAFVCLNDGWGGDLGAVLDAFAAQLPPSGSDGTAVAEPLSLADPATVRQVLTDAGFLAVDCAPVEATQVWGRDASDAAGFLAEWGPLRHQLVRVDPATARRATEAMTTALRRHESPDGVRMRGTAWLVTARRPG